MIDDLTAKWGARTDSDDYLAEFIPLRLVTIIEVSVREMVRELTDHGQHFVGKAEILVKNARLDLAFAEHLDGNRLSVGDFVAHSISVSGLDQVMATLSALLDDFPAKLETSFPRWKEQAAEWPLPPIVQDYSQTMGRLSKLFEVRHILAHELPRDPAVDFDAIPGFLSATREFVEAADWVVVACLRGNLPQTQLAMNQEASDELEELHAEMSGKLEEVKALPGIDLQKVDLAQRNWERFAESEATLIASNVEGGSMFPMVWSAGKAELVEDRIEQLERIVDGWMS
jgi:uncharacterized protein YecT (DUF1311 family)